MRMAMMMMVGTLLAMVGGCQSDMTGARPAYNSDAALTASPSDNHPDVAVGDAYFEEMLGRYELGGR